MGYTAFGLGVSDFSAGEDLPSYYEDYNNKFLAACVYIRVCALD